MDETKMEIDLSKPINKEGLSLMDLVVTLVKECAKQGLYVAGTILDPDNVGMARTFGAGSMEAIHSILAIGAALTSHKENVQDTKKFSKVTN